LICNPIQKQLEIGIPKRGISACICQRLGNATHESLLPFFEFQMERGMVNDIDNTLKNLKFPLEAPLLMEVFIHVESITLLS